MLIKGSMTCDCMLHACKQGLEAVIAEERCYAGGRATLNTRRNNPGASAGAVRQNPSTDFFEDGNPGQVCHVQQQCIAVAFQQPYLTELAMISESCRR